MRTSLALSLAFLASTGVFAMPESRKIIVARDDQGVNADQAAHQEQEHSDAQTKAAKEAKAALPGFPYCNYPYTDPYYCPQQNNPCQFGCNYQTCPQLCYNNNNPCQFGCNYQTCPQLCYNNPNPCAFGCNYQTCPQLCYNNNNNPCQFGCNYQFCPQLCPGGGNPVANAFANNPQPFLDAASSIANAFSPFGNNNQQQDQTPPPPAAN